MSLNCGFFAVTISVGIFFGVMNSFAEKFEYSVNDCVGIALKNNDLNKISTYDVRIAEAILMQAKSLNWPTISAGFRAMKMDDSLTFDYPASVFQTPSIPLPPALGGGVIPGQAVEIPAQKVDNIGDELIQATIDLKYPLYTGGLRPALKEQALAGVTFAKEGRRRTEAEVTRDVRRAYYGTVLARKMVDIASLTFSRMEVTLALTKEAYENGLGKVNRTDYLRNQSFLEMIRSTKTALVTQQTLADTALVCLMGLKRGTEITPSEKELPVFEMEQSADELIYMAQYSNPHLAQVQAAMQVYEAGIRKAKSGYKPKIGLVAGYARNYSNIDSGLMTTENRDVASVGIAGEMSIFKGFRTKGSILEASLKLEQLKMQEEALIKGLSLQIDHVLAEWLGASERKNSSFVGLTAASENRDLNIRAYRHGMVEPKDVIEAQVLEAMLSVGHQKVLYECVDSRIKLSFLVGNSVAGFGEKE